MPLRIMAPMTRMRRCDMATIAIFFRSGRPRQICMRDALNAGHFFTAVHAVSQISLRMTGGPSRVIWPKRFLLAD